MLVIVLIKIFLKRVIHYTNRMKEYVVRKKFSLLFYIPSLPFQRQPLLKVSVYFPGKKKIYVYTSMVNHCICLNTYFMFIQMSIPYTLFCHPFFLTFFSTFYFNLHRKFSLFFVTFECVIFKLFLGKYSILNHSA